MVLKVVRTVVIGTKDNIEGQHTVSRFFDGFSNIVVDEVDLNEEGPRDAGEIANYCFYTNNNTAGSNPRFGKRVTLIGEENRTIYFDNLSGYQVYLMSNEGKTIERL